MGKGANGQTIIREIVTPKNPQTQGQMIQRIIMKTVMTAYSRMKEITDHSFEGISPGQATMSEFMRINLNAIREGVAVEIANGRGLDDIYAFTPLKSETLAPNAYIVSKGSLPQVIAVANTIPGYSASIENISGNTYGDVINSLGLQRGDQLTFISIQGTDPQDAQFFYARVILDPRNADGTEAPLTTEFINDSAIVRPNPRNEGAFNTLTYDAGTSKITFGFNRRPMLDAGVIVSRRDISGSWLRSDCTLSFTNANVVMFKTLGECLSMLESEDIQTAGNRYLNQAGRARTATMESQNLYTTTAEDGIAGLTLVNLIAEEGSRTYHDEDTDQDVTITETYLKAVDTNGNKYFIECGGSSYQSYGMFLGQKEGYINQAWKNAPQTPIAPSASNKLICGGPLSDTIWDWLNAQGVSYQVWVVETN